MFSWLSIQPVELKSIAKVLNQKVSRRPKCFSFFFYLRWASSNLHDSFMMVFTQNSSISTEQCTRPSFFSRFEVSGGGSNRSLKNYGFLSDAIFSSRARMCTNHLEMKCNFITQDCWIGNTVGVQGVSEESLVWSMILQPVLHTSIYTEEACENRLCNRWQTSTQACICC